MKNKRGISSDTLKYIALLTMLIDHIASGLIAFYAGSARDIGMARELMNAAGRIAFPIFAYQLVQGFIFTKNRLKYALNFLIFAVISEIPFDYCFFGRIYLNHQNVMLELFTGLMLLTVLEYVNEKFFGIDFARCADVWTSPLLKITAAVFFNIAIALIFMIPAQLLHFDYGGKGIVLITSFYILYRNRELMVILCPLLFIASFYPVNLLLNHASEYQALSSLKGEIPSCISFAFIYFDNGIRKIKGKRKYLFYAFYPLHMSIIYVIRLLII